ncbi:ATP-binding cassette domain-containing protein [Thiohalobacter sp. IOR34]|uniref:ATP-binding cassette domain-containing protein n=1 Tax=Thiohalobacter sp. IOR34 TaxID=3057176 RepID=UPI0025AFCB41|nr:ATP-binding cassette domain-containing protein [Thiohalobacter sp. IOR34]WJW75338.1 ATP-binding cassette domain-containing protein [Thiohalobacter sp. IOR34]
MRGDPVLSVRDLRQLFAEGGREVRALDGVSFDIAPGQVTGLIGPDGAGKTTLMRLACGLLRPASGTIRVLGLDALREAQAVQSAVGYMPQRFGLYEDLSVQENLDLYAELQGIPPERRATRYAELMQMTGLAPFTARLAGRLSGGMKQKLGLACALLRAPRLLLLDEPTVGVDPVSRRELWAIVYRQVQEQGMSVLLSTAYLDEAERCDEVLLLHQGRLLGQGPPASFSEEVEGRVFQISAAGISHRRLQTRLGAASGVIDALVEGEAVRVVMERPGTPDITTLLPDLAAARIEPVAPRFEDAFVARLKSRQEAASSLDGLDLHIEGGGDEDVIRVQDLVRRFGDFVAVDKVSFRVRRGEIFGLLGANGAGKTTTFRMLCGLLPASGGELSVAGHDLHSARAEARRHIGYMAQKFSLYGDLSVLQNLRFFASAYGLRGRRQEQRVTWAIDTFELGDYREANARDLPLGFKQRLSFAAALMHEPEILFLDEPTSGVDPLARRDFWTRTNALAEAGVTVLVTTHFMEEANYCDRLVIMADGRVLAEGTPQAMKAGARTPDNPDPTMEDAFIRLIEQRNKQDQEATA